MAQNDTRAAEIERLREEFAQQQRASVLRTKIEELIEARLSERASVLRTKIEELIEARLSELETQLARTNEQIERLERDQVWTAHQPWSADGLPVPRIEMRLVCFGPEDSERVDSLVHTQYLVYQHFLGHIEAVPLGQTKSASAWANVEQAVRMGRTETDLSLPYRDGRHAIHNAAHFGVPMIITHGDEARRCLEVNGAHMQEPIERRGGG